MFSVIVPAHNEAAVIAAGLEAMTAGADPSAFEVIVVANGCTDETAQVARRFGGPVRVLEIETASKIAALNAGDEAARSFPRVYVDADVLISFSGLETLANRLRRGDVLAVAPTPRFELKGSSWPVRAFYAVNALLPSSREGIGGSGVYALSETGRSRFGAFPKVVADDAFVRIHFKPSERETLTSVVTRVFGPKRLRDLVAIKTRSHLGNYELANAYPDLWRNRGTADNRKALLPLLRSVRLWPHLLVYLAVKIEARRRALARLRRAKDGTIAWARDDGSRIREGSASTAPPPESAGSRENR